MGIFGGLGKTLGKGFSGIGNGMGQGLLGAFLGGGQQQDDQQPLGIVPQLLMQQQQPDMGADLPGAWGNLIRQRRAQGGGVQMGLPYSKRNYKGGGLV